VNREGILTRKATQFLVIPLFTVMPPNDGVELLPNSI
jgi:hypothetical protein